MIFGNQFLIVKRVNHHHKKLLPTKYDIIEQQIKMIASFIIKVFLSYPTTNSVPELIIVKPCLLIIYLIGTYTLTGTGCPR